jgi:stage IV sporulation protein FB
LQNYWYLGRWFRIPVSMHWTVLLILPWMWLIMRDWLAALIGSVAYCLLLLAHEGGHALMARWRGLKVEGITLNGLHGETSHEYPRKPWDDIAIAWSGVGVQFLILLAALALSTVPPGSGNLYLGLFVGVVLDVFTTWNVFLIIIALLPIGPMDGHRAWRVIPLLRQRFRRRGHSGKVVKLDPVRRRKLEQNSEKLASDIIQNLGKKK